MFHLEAVLLDETLSAGFLARYRSGSLTRLAWNCLMLHEKLSFVLGLQALNITIPDIHMDDKTKIIIIINFICVRKYAF